MDKLCKCQKETLAGIIDAANSEWWTGRSGPYPDPNQELDDIISTCTCKEEPKPACEQLAGTVCDHIVGKAIFYANYDNVVETCECLESEFYKGKWQREYKRKRDKTWSSHNYCYKCGEEIDWDAIEKKLNLKKDGLD